MKTRSPSFVRARQPDQIEERREAIFQAALALFVQKGFENVSLSDIAERTGSAKSNLYRYFENREHIYLVILQNEGETWEKKVLAALKHLGGKGTTSEVADIITGSFLKADRYCLLISILNCLKKTCPRSWLLIFDRCSLTEGNVSRKALLRHYQRVPCNAFLE